MPHMTNHQHEDPYQRSGCPGRWSLPLHSTIVLQSRQHCSKKVLLIRQIKKGNMSPSTVAMHLSILIPVHDVRALAATVDYG